MVDAPRYVKTRRSGDKDSGNPQQSKTLLTVIVVLAVLAMILPTTIVVMVGMVPTMVAYVVDVTPGRYACRCVAGLNVAGVAPSLHQLWTGANDVAAAVGIIADPFAWLSFYGASAVGWMLFLGVPNAVATVQTLNAKRRANAYRESQRQLIHEFGESIRAEASIFKASLDAGLGDTGASGESEESEDGAKQTDRPEDGGAAQEDEEGNEEPADT